MDSLTSCSGVAVLAHHCIFVRDTETQDVLFNLGYGVVSTFTVYIYLYMCIYMKIKLDSFLSFLCVLFAFKTRSYELENEKRSKSSHSDATLLRPPLLLLDEEVCHV